MTITIEKEFGHGRKDYLLTGECDAHVKHERGSYRQPPSTWIDSLTWTEPLTLSVAGEDGWEVLPSIPDNMRVMVDDMVDAIIYEMEEEA